jgi:crotonobetainyl-CoA:carnitine CoA-transferase CaiB-like acyl-CoA transferase
MRARGAAERCARADGTEMSLIASPLRMSRTPPRTERAPPALGADTEAVLADLLGAGPEDFERWRAAGAI